MSSNHDTVLIRKSTLITSKPSISTQQYVLWSLFAIFVIITATGLWYAAQTEQVKISLLSKYVEGDTVEYLVEWNEEQRPKSIAFAVRNSPVKESWEVTPLMRKKQGNFSTIGWDTTQYTYLITVTERNGKSYTVTGKFELQKRDIVQPTVEVTGINPHYNEGESLHYSINCSDDRNLKQVFFEIKDTQINEKWQVNNKSYTKEGDIATSNLGVNREYTYVATAEDMAGNRFEKTGNFFLEGLDKMAPVGKIVGVFQDYHLGDQVNFSIEASDDRSLQDIEFTIENGLVKQIWHTNNHSSRQQSSFSTTGWQAGNYEYVLKITDSSGNMSVGKSNFVLGEVDKMPPSLSYKDIAKSYTVGDTINYSLEAADNKELEKIAFAVSSSNVQETWIANGTNYKLHASFSTVDWQPGNYSYSFTAMDKAHNSTGEIIGAFILLPPTAQPPDVTTLLTECKEHLAADRLMLGKTGSAFECYQQVLEIESKNADALSGIQAIEARYHSLIESALADNELEKVATFLTRLEQVNKKANGINELRRKLKQAQNTAHTPSPPVQTQPVVKPVPTVVKTPAPKTSLKQEIQKVIKKKPVVVERVKSPPPTAPKPPEPVACKTCNCNDVLTKLSIGVEPLNQEEKSFLRTQCR
jgi:hypothetical protein